MMTDTYVLSTWLSSCLQGFALKGWDVDAIKKAANLSHAVLERPYCTANDVFNIFDAAQALHGDSVGLTARLGVVPTTFQSLSLAVLAAPSFSHGLMLMEKYSDYVSNGVSYYFDEFGQVPKFGFKVAPQVGELPPLVATAMLATTVRTFRFIQPKNASVQKIDISMTRPDNADEYERYFKVPIQWAADSYTLYLDSACLNAPSMHANAILCEQNKQACAEAIEKNEHSRFLKNLEGRILSLLGNGPITLDAIADLLNISVRTLQRRIRAENTSFGLVLQNVRKQKAIDYLKHSNKSISDIAQLLGFTDAGNFSRAFKKWCDCSPEYYRRGAIAP